jgi:hypothetical protein
MSEARLRVLLKPQILSGHHCSLTHGRTYNGLWESFALLVAAPHGVTETPIQSVSERLGPPLEIFPYIDRP